MRNYSTARGLLSFIEFVAWTLVVAGVVVALLGMGVGNLGGASIGRSGAEVLGGALGAVPGIVLAIFGLLFAALVQIARANVDTAEMTGKMLTIAEEHLRVAKKAANVSFAPSVSVTPSHAPASTAKSGSIRATAPTASVETSGPASGQPLLAQTSSSPRFIASFEHAGLRIQRTATDQYHVDGQVFDAVGPAKAYAEKHGSPAKLDDKSRN